ncbi:MAG: SUMF1/EgtB/PvdO family nonheme iron enzyme [Hyphomonadaceae bacterium]|nr:SUMF1/EgtB/PvdO family nonheme iron enzyme [Hyphomonadaceae bacterium]
MPKIFISYRRNDTKWPAEKLYKFLAERLPKDDLFMDLDSLSPGEKFAEKIREALNKIDIMLVLIGHKWTGESDTSPSRMEDEADFVRLEIETAIERNVRLIPVLVDGAEIPTMEILPLSISELVEHQAEYLTQRTFDYDVARIAKSIAPEYFRERGLFHRPGASIMAIFAIIAVSLIIATVFRAEDPSPTDVSIEQIMQNSDLAYGDLTKRLYEIGFLASPDPEQDTISVETSVEAIRAATKYQAPPIDLVQRDPRQIETFLNFLLSRYQPSVDLPDMVSTSSNGFRVFTDCSFCPEMIEIPAGTFEFGSPRSEQLRDPDEAPAVTTVIADAFSVSKYEITVAQFAEFVNDTGYSPPGRCRISNGVSSWEWVDGLNYRSPEIATSADHPVTCIDWYAARAYAVWLTQKTGFRYRLLTEVEWEYAAKGEFKSAGFVQSENKSLCDVANFADAETNYDWRYDACSDGYAMTSPVGALLPNEFGLHDMLGNVWEWVEDCYDFDREPDALPFTSKNYLFCTAGVTKGGSWSSYPSRVRIAKRNNYSRSFASDVHGFRVARNIVPQ